MRNETISSRRGKGLRRITKNLLPMYDLGNSNWNNSRPGNQMTLRTELLAKVDAQISQTEGFLDPANGIYAPQCAVNYANQHLRFMRALRVSIEFHAPREYKSGFFDVVGTLHHIICSGCSDQSQQPFAYPCKPLKSILGVNK